MLQTKIIEYQKIQELIDQFNSEKLKENAYFGIFDEAEYSYIKANKEGFRWVGLSSQDDRKVSDSSIPFLT